MTPVPQKKYLLAPGPTPVPEAVLLAMAAPTIHHRTPEFEATVKEIRSGLQAVFQTAQDVIVLASSGTGAMEASIVNTLSPGDVVIVVNGGKFGERWTKVCREYGVEVEEIEVEWGKAVDPATVEAILQRRPETRAVLLQASETSTTAMHPVKELADLTRARETLLVVDGITAVGVADMPMDDLGIDVLVSGSQKAFMLPPGLAFLALSEKAWKATERSSLPKFYFDLTRERAAQQKNTTAYTPAINLMFGLRKALELMVAEGLPEIFARHDRLARATRAGAAGLGLDLVAAESPSSAATGVFLPEGIPGGDLQKYLRHGLGVEVAGGQDRFKGKILRLAHLGHVGMFDVVTGMAALEFGLARFGVEAPLGRGVAAAQAVLAEGLPALPAK
ncbi:MAG: alanine--glyoxylate aminotransferase family protein [Candidatus Binatia bacterium]|nr:alanine--glyoxylate aminotransferase family protein [Candidatus Binatia bacterium]